LPTAAVIAAFAVAFSGSEAASANLGREQARLKDIENQINATEARRKKMRADADQLQDEAVRLRRRLVKAAARLRAKESEVLQSQRELKGLEEVEQKKLALLDRRGGELSSSLAALQRLSRQPGSAFLTRPETAVRAVRGAALLSSVVPDLRADAVELGEEIKALNTVRLEINAERKTLTQGIAHLKSDRSALDELVQQKRRQQRRLSETANKQATHAKKLASKAKSVRELIGRLNAAHKEREKNKARSRETRRLERLNSAVTGTAPISTARGSLPLPVSGRITRGFGQPDDTGSPLRGISVETIARAQVTAPYDGQIVYAGPFRDYGQLLIIAHGEGYHTLLAGMSQIDGVVGQWVLAGEPVGHMGPHDAADRSNPKPKLYVELRRHGEPINPLPWLTANKRKVTG
jgi:murein hydrolase activator